MRDTTLGESACLAPTVNGPINRANLNNIALAVVFANRRDGESLAAAFRRFQLDTADAIRALRDSHRLPATEPEDRSSTHPSWGNSPSNLPQREKVLI